MSIQMDPFPDTLPALHIEVRLTPKCSIPYHTIQEHVHLFLLATRTSLTCFQEVVVVGTSMSDYSYVRMFVERIWVAECSDKLLTQETSIDMDHVYLQFHLYQLHDQGAIEEYGGHAIGDGSDMEGTLTMAYHWELPCQEFEGIWSNLIFEEELQLKLLDYVRTTMLFSDKHVNPDLIAWNRVVLLHGPPGTGKTSLCRGLAQKLSIRLEGRYQHVKLLEINSHSLFSKWYSESGKLVQRMFDQIWTMVEDEGAFICVLIDEVESLAAARRAALSGNEPSDSIRVVNALLTQIDRLRKRKNVLILTTSNITEAIDIAFIDRADIKLYVGLPTKGAIYSILQSTIEELMRVGIIRPKVEMMNWETYRRRVQIQPRDITSPDLTLEKSLYRMADFAHGMSGRSIRKLAFLAYARCIQSPSTTMASFTDALFFVIKEEQEKILQLPGQ